MYDINFFQSLIQSHDAACGDKSTDSSGTSDDECVKEICCKGDLVYALVNTSCLCPPEGIILPSHALTMDIKLIQPDIYNKFFKAVYRHLNDYILLN